MTTPRIYWQQGFLDAHRADALNNAERERLATMRSPRRQQEYRTSRVLLHEALARETGHRLDASTIPASGPIRLPRITGIHAGLAHAGEAAACALCNGPVGLDLEWCERAPDWEPLAQRWFTGVENAYLESLPAEQGRDQFLLLWTLKEAWLKATHQGIAGNLRQLQLNSRPHGRGPADWRLSVPTGERGWHAASARFHGFWLSVVWQGPAGAPLLQNTAPPKQWLINQPLRARPRSS